MNIQLHAACILLLVGVIQSRSTFNKHAIGRQLSRECSANQFNCVLFDRCIPESWYCDGDDDCWNAADEPLTCPQITCSGNDFKCATRNRCLPPKYVCNGEDDCDDNSDEIEEFCKNRDCPEGYLRCNNGICVDRDDYCMGRYWGCYDRTALYTQTTCPNIACNPNYVKCQHTAVCIPTSEMCDGYRSCPDGSDETNCGHITCENNQFRCASRARCLDNVVRCNGLDDCGDGSDELDCSDITCSDDYVRCADGLQCIWKTGNCNGYVECRDGSDERDCRNRACLAGYFQCNDGKCVNTIDYCSGYNYRHACEDGTDISSSICADIQCPEDYIRHPITGVCTHSNQLCDGYVKFDDGWDEQEEFCQIPRQCAADWSELTKCPGIRQCIQAQDMCNGLRDCRDDSDEDLEHCGNTFNCLNGQTKCPGTRRCVFARYLCDAENDCGDNSDEDLSFCSTRSCERNELRCDNGQCIGRDGFCLGYFTCADGSLSPDDELCDGQLSIDYDVHHWEYNETYPLRKHCGNIPHNTERICGSQFGGVFDKWIYSRELTHLQDMNLADMCRPIQKWFRCIEGMLNACNPVTYETEQINIIRALLDYVCVEHFNVLNRNKACLLQQTQVSESSYWNRPKYLVLMKARTRCSMYRSRYRRDLCLPRDFRDCVKQVVVDQCGDELSEVFDGAVDRLHQQLQCSSDFSVAHQQHKLKAKRSQDFPFDIEAFNEFF